MQLNFEIEQIIPGIHHLLSSLKEQSQSPNTTQQFIQLTQNIINQIEKKIHTLVETEISDIIVYLTQIQYNIANAGTEQIEAFIKKIEDSRNKLLLTIDPTQMLIKRLINPLSDDYELQKLTANKIEICLQILIKIFQNQNPILEDNRSYVYMKGKGTITFVDTPKWIYDKNPLQDGLTLSFWFIAQDLHTDVKLFSFTNKQKMGFELLLKGQKLYYQRLEDQKKFTLIKSKNNLVYLCDIQTNVSSFLTVEFQIKKKIFLKNYLVANVFYNNSTFNNIEVDIPTGNFKPDNIEVQMLSNFKGKIYSIIVMSKNQYALIQQLNIPRGFMTENDIRNLTFNFENYVSKIIFFYTPIRAQQQNTNVKLFDVFHKNDGLVTEGLIKTNLSIKKQVAFYGGLVNITSFLVVIQTIKQDSNIFNSYLTLLKSIFMNKPGSQQQIKTLNIFGCIRQYLLRTKMRLFNQTTIHLFKQIYVALGTKHIRQQYLKDLIWALKPSVHLSKQMFLLYCNLIQSFYNQDIQTALSVFDIKDIIGYIIDYIQPRGQCCCEHSMNKITPEQYNSIASQYFKIINNILTFKRSQSEINCLVGQVIQIFTLKTSVCFAKAFLQFLDKLCSSDERIEAIFAAQIKPSEIRNVIYMFLANIPCFKVKNQILKLIFNYYSDDSFLKEKSTAFDLSICMRISDFQNWKNSTMSHDDKRSHDSSDFGSEPKTTSLTEVVKYLDKTRQFPIPQFVNQPKLIDTILKWSFKHPRPQDNPNNGLLFLSDIYKYSSTKQRQYIWYQLGQVLEPSRFDVQVLIWLTESLLQQLIKQNEDKTVISLILSNISKYHIFSVVSAEVHQIALIINTMIRSIFSFRFSKESRQSQEIGVIAYLLIFNSFVKGCNEFDIGKIQQLSSIIMKSCQKHLRGYFISANFESDIDFQQRQDEGEDALPKVIIQTMQNMYQLLFKICKGRSQSRIISEQNSMRNKKILELLFPLPSLFDSPRQVSFMCMIFVTLQSVFQHLDEFEIQEHKKCLTLIEKFLILQMQLIQNCGGVENIRDCLEQVKSIFLNVLSFIQIKFFQYFHYEFPKNAGFDLQNKLRNNNWEMKQHILDVFFTVLQQLKYIDEMGSKQHKSFYDLMKTKKILKSKLCLLHTEWVRPISDKFLQFSCISNLRENARQKLDSFLLQRKISKACIQIQKIITLKIVNFTKKQRYQFVKIEKKSLKSYQDSQRDYYKVSRNFEQKMNTLMIEYRSKQNNQQTKRANNQDKNKKQAKKAQFDIWQQSRLYQGFWTSTQFYKFSQSQQMIKYNNDLSKFYKRVRSLKQTSTYTMPFIEIQLNQYPISTQESNNDLDELLQQDDSNSKTKQKRSQKYIKMGLQFFKRKVIDRIMRSSSDKMMSQESYFSDVIINDQMTLKPGELKLNRQRIEFSFKPVSSDIYHLTLFKFKIKQLQKLSQTWKIHEISCIKFRKFLLKSNSVELFFRNGNSILFIFVGDSGPNKCNQFCDILYKLRKLHPNTEELPSQIFWKPTQPIKLIQKVDLTKKWMNNEISNFEYLMGLNIMSGRSNNDLNQYPVLPWIFSGYSSFIDFKDHFRDFSKNMGCLGTEQRKQKFKKVYDNIENFKSINQQYHFGFHYSNLPIVIQFLIRIQPYTQAAKQLQGGKFDVADRLFSSISESYDNAIRQMSDVRELIPQFFYLPQLLINMNELVFGIQQSGKKVDNIELPLGFKNPYQFIEFHRQSLQSQYVSENIQKWIDLVFGYKNSGKEAETSINKFYYLTYETNVDIGQEDQNRISIESQMAFFGKTPSQLFQKAHPQKIAIKQKPLLFPKLSRMRIIKQDQCQQSNNASKTIQIIHLSYCSFTKRYIVIRKDGKGMVFILVQKQTSFYSDIYKQFSLNLDSHEQIWIRDDRCQNIPIVGILGSAIVVGSYWGGRLMNYDILNEKVQLCWKHTQTITSIAHSQHGKIVVSCSQNGQAVVWEYGHKIRLQFKHKLVLHYSNISHVSINFDLKIFSTAGNDGFVHITDLFTYKNIRSLKFDQSVNSVSTFTYPYSLILIGFNGKQKCYSINGQFLSEANYEAFQPPVKFKQIGFKQRVLMRVRQQILFFKLPSFEIVCRYELKKGDEKAKNFLLDHNCMLYTVPNTVVCAQRNNNI